MIYTMFPQEKSHLASVVGNGQGILRDPFVQAIDLEDSHQDVVLHHDDSVQVLYVITTKNSLLSSKFP